MGLEADKLPPSNAEARKARYSKYSTNTGATLLKPFVSILSLGKESKFEIHIYLKHVSNILTL